MHTSAVIFGTLCIIAGSMVAIVHGIVGFAVITVGVAAVFLPLFRGRTPKAALDGAVLHITGAFADWRINVADIDNVYTINNIEVAAMVLGYYGHRYIGGRFVEKLLGDVHIAADTEIHLFVVLKCGKKKYVFNAGDLHETEFMYRVLLSASRMM